MADATTNATALIVREPAPETPLREQIAMLRQDAGLKRLLDGEDDIAAAELEYAAAYANAKRLGLMRD